MSTYESTYKSLIQGISQQLPSERLPGQLTAQVNMVSDPVTNLRRRPGVQYKTNWTWAGATESNVLAWFTDLAGSRVHILLNTSSGAIKILNEAYGTEADLDAGDYLVASDPRNIRACAVGNEFFLANCEKSPVVEVAPSDANPANSGFFYVTSGAFGKTYTVSVVYSDGTITATYTTPGGTGPSDASLSTPEYIATNLANQLKNAGTSVPVVMTDIRITSWEFWEEVTDTYLQKNTGTASSPVWTNVTPGDEFSIAQIEQKYLRARYVSNSGDVPGYLQINFQVKVNGAWQSTIYSSTGLILPLGPGTMTKIVPVNLFTSITTPGTPLLYVATDGPYVYITRSGGIAVSTNVGSAYLLASQSGFVTSEGNLPARLPAAASGYIVRVGTGESPKYYQYNSANVEWIEVAKYGSPTSVRNVPISIIWNGSAWALNIAAFEGRLSGDDITNPAHEFMSSGITGIGTYQGRLVILSGALVSLSASNKPRRFFRSTVTSILSSDPIEIGSGQNSAAAYEWAVPFQKDLILFSSAYQAVLPSGNAAVTPSNATVVPTSGHGVDTTSSPINLGRTLMYCNPRSEDFFGIMEMIPSPYTDSQYVSQDSTPHLPKFMGGRCRFAVSSGVSSMAMFAPTGDKNSLMIHEYHWSNDTKDQQAWHQWQFEYPVANAYFVGDVSVLVFVKNSVVVLGTLDARAGSSDKNGIRRAFVDLNVPVAFTNNTITVPAWMTAFDPDITVKLRAVSGTGALAGELIGTSVSGSNTLTTVRSWPNGTAVIGVPYYSGFIPTPPQTTDYNGDIIHDGKATLLRYILKTKNSSDFDISVSDEYSAVTTFAGNALAYDSPELSLGRGKYSNLATIKIPARTDMRTTTLELSTSGVGEFNVTALEYIAKFSPKVKRR